MAVTCMAIPCLTIPCVSHGKLCKIGMFHGTKKHGPRKHVMTTCKHVCNSKDAASSTIAKCCYNYCLCFLLYLNLSTQITAIIK